MPNSFIITYVSSTGPRITEWSMDRPEDFCETSGQPVATPLGATQCSTHAGLADPCPTAQRIPPECTHSVARLDPAAAPATPRCLDCGAEGQDVTEEYRERYSGPTPGPADNEDPA